jgi:glycosyltransferase involved in cell wall biosynthesis
MMKILYHHRIASKDGQYVHIEELIKALKSRGHEIVLVEPKQIKQKAFGKSSAAVDTIRTLLPGYIHELLEFVYSFYDCIILVFEILKHRPDCIYERYNLFFISGVVAKKLFGLPLILEVNSPLLEERNNNDGISLKALASWTETYAWRNADFVLPVTAVLADKILKKGVLPERCVVIPNGINLEKFSGNNSIDIKQKYNLHNKLILGFVGFARIWHGLDRVLHVISKNMHCNFHFLMVGDGPARPELERLAKELNIQDRITITGIVDRDAVAEYIAAFDIALQPDVVEYASPLKLFEYMAMGKAILAPNRKNILEVLRHRDNALLFNVDEDNAFEEQLQILCNEPKLRDELGKNARQTIHDKKLFWDENANKIEGLIKQSLHLP